MTWENWALIKPGSHVLGDSSSLVAQHDQHHLEAVLKKVLPPKTSEISLLYTIYFKTLVCNSRNFIESTRRTSGQLPGFMGKVARHEFFCILQSCSVELWSWVREGWRCLQSSSPSTLNRSPPLSSLRSCCKWSAEPCWIFHKERCTAGSAQHPQDHIEGHFHCEKGSPPSPTWRSCPFSLAVLAGEKPIGVLVFPRWLPSVNHTHNWGTWQKRAQGPGCKERLREQDPVVGWKDGELPRLSQCQTSCTGDTMVYLSSPPDSWK